MYTISESSGCTAILYTALSPPIHGVTSSHVIPASMDFIICGCRKPAPGLLTQASQEHDIDLSSSYMVGDKVIDIELAHGVGAKGILVLTGYGKDELKKIRDASVKDPICVARNLFDAVRWIIEDLGSEHHGNTDHKIECHR